MGSGLDFELWLVGLGSTLRWHLRPAADSSTRHVLAILYGLARGIRSSRKLEYACCYNIDFIWLVEGRTIDHATFAGFRTRFREELKDCFAKSAAWL